MINPQNAHIQKVLDLLGQLNLTSDELVTAEDYMSGDVQAEALERLTFRDLSGVGFDVNGSVGKIFRDFINRGKQGEAGKLFDILFTIGKSTIYNMIPYDVLTSGKEGPSFITPEKKAAIHAARMGIHQNYISEYQFESLIELAENKPENLKKALDYEKNKNANGKLIILAAYFFAKYPDIKEKTGIAAGIGKFLGANENNNPAGIHFDEQDLALMKKYEDIAISGLGNMYKNQVSQLVIDEITNAINRNGINERILKLADTNTSIDSFMLKLIGGTSFINYTLSNRLKNLVSICIAANTNEMLGVMEGIDLRMDLRVRGGSFDRVFGMDSEKLIIWAAMKKHVNILRSQFKDNRDMYLKCLSNADFNSFSIMSAIIKELDLNLYQERIQRDHGRMYNIVIETFKKTAEQSLQCIVEKYLKGEENIDVLYKYYDKLAVSGYLYNNKYFEVLDSYQRSYGRDGLCNRCEAYMMFIAPGYFRSSIVRNGEIDKNEVKRIFQVADSEKAGMEYQVKAVVIITDDLYYRDRWKKAFIDAAKDVFRIYLETRREEMIHVFQTAESFGRYFGIQLLSENAEQNKNEILSFSQDTAKTVKEGLLEVLYNQKGWEEDIIKLISSKKAADREISIRVLAKWDAEKYSPILTEALEKEKNGKVRSLLESVLNVGDSQDSGKRTITQEDLVKELHKGGKKRSLAWAYETPFSKVHMKNGSEADEEYLQAVLLCYSSMGTCGVSQSAASLAEALNENEFAIYVNELFDKWMEAGAEAKKRWVLYAASIHGGADIVNKLYHQIQEWPQIQRGAIAAEAVQALALNPQPQALLIVDGISRKFKFKQVKAAAGKALEFAASQLGITKEELADRIVPDLGFNENMERIFDYGERKFTVTITPALEIEVFDENGKKLKNLPAPGKRDDEVKAAGAYEEFKQMKKQMKTTVSSQKMRLEMALSTEREWSIQAWKDLFVKNPVMHQFAIGLIWGIYEDRKLVSSFRYMEDGSFNTEDEDEFELPQEGHIGLIHPIELSEESRKAWKQQLEDYEITQPVEQLDRPVYYRTKEEENSKSLERFGGCILNDLSLGGKLMALGWYRGSVQDAGGFYTYYREDPELLLGVELHFSGSFVGGENDDVTVYDARFYKAGTIKRGSYEYDEADEKKSYGLKDVPERYFSEIVLQLAKATASSKERNENWKNKH